MKRNFRRLLLMGAVSYSALAISQDDRTSAAESGALLRPGEVTFRHSTLPDTPTAKGIDLVDGAIVCSSMNLSSWLFGQINMARHARIVLSPEIRKQSALVNGYDVGEEPRPSDFNCVIVPIGTPLAVERDNYVPVVSGVMPNGRPFSGVTLPEMVGSQP